MKQQLKLQLEKKPEPKKRIHYLELSIHQKINVKANSAGFQRLWILHSLTCWKTHIGFIRPHEHNPDELNENWFWHNKNTKNRPWDSLKHGQLFREI
jgi:hypothetical protein